MKKNLLVAVGYVLSWCVCVDLLGGQDVGEVSEEIKCKKDKRFSYYVYTPPGYDPKRKTKYPVMFLFSPGGGNPGVMDRYKQGADKNIMCLAVSVQSKNGSLQSNAAIDSMIKDVLKRYRVDSKRCYASGFSGGGRESFDVISRHKKFAGILPCGAGAIRTKTKIPVFGACGTHCFNRRDMGITFYKKLRSKKKQLKFFPGGHRWADEKIITQGMIWLNGNYVLSKNLKESDQFCKMVLELINENKDTDPFYAYDLAEFLSGYAKKIRGAKPSLPIMKELAKKPEIQNYIEGKKSIDDFAGKYFSSLPYIPKEHPQKTIDKADELAKKYAGTPVSKVFEGFKKPIKR